MLALAVIHYHRTFDLKQKIVLVERFDDLRDNLLELRRYEKNYFLARDANSLHKMTYYLFETEDLFESLKGQIVRILGAKEYDKYRRVLKNYKIYLNKNVKIVESGLDGYDDQGLRETGKALNDFTDNLIRVKRHRIEQSFNHMMLLPVAFIAIFMVIFFIIYRTAQKDILKPLYLLQGAAENITKGIFEPVKYSLPKSNEVAQCLTAFNKMSHEIETRQEQLLQSRKMASIGTFTSGIAHELNNPINNISLIVDTLMEDGEDISQDERFALHSDLVEQSDRAAEIVKSLLEFSRTDQEQLEEISLEKLVDKTVRLVKNEMQLQRIRFKKNIKGTLLPIWIDKGRLQQALLNLLINAIQAMPDGGTLSISIGPSENTSEIRIDVADTGKGIPADQLDSIFDPFFTTKKEGDGTGLGLSVTYGIIQKHGGRIQVKSKPGEGTCFSVFLKTMI
jgi:signal transduction histidine kinase